MLFTHICFKLFYYLELFRPNSSKLEVFRIQKVEQIAVFFGLVGIIVHLIIHCNDWLLCLDISYVSYCLSKGLSFLLKCFNSLLLCLNDMLNTITPACLYFVYYNTKWLCLVMCLLFSWPNMHCLKFLLRHLMLWWRVKQLTSTINGIGDEKISHLYLR